MDRRVLSSIDDDDDDDKNDDAIVESDDEWLTVSVHNCPEMTHNFQFLEDTSPKNFPPPNAMTIHYFIFYY